MNLGLFYQSGYRYVACYHALKQFRKFYPTAPVALYEDNTDLLRPISKKFNCFYDKTKMQGFNDPNSGRPAYNLLTILSWLDRVYEACITSLKNAEWIMNFEDDVWFKREIKYIPSYDLAGICGWGFNESLYNYLQTKTRGIYGCGGSVFKREKFLHAYDNLKTIDWKRVEALDKRPLEWTDSALTFIFLHSNLSVGDWKEAGQYSNNNVPHLSDRQGWPGSMESLENIQGDKAIIHCWKPYYYPTFQEIQDVDKDLEKYN